MKHYILILAVVLLAGCAGTSVVEPLTEEARMDELIDHYRTQVAASIKADGRKQARSEAEQHMKNLSNCSYLRTAQSQRFNGDTIDEHDPSLEQIAERLRQADEFTLAVLAMASASAIEFDNELIGEVAVWDHQTNEKDGVTYFHQMVGVWADGRKYAEPEEQWQTRMIAKKSWTDGCNTWGEAMGMEPQIQ